MNYHHVNEEEMIPFKVPGSIRSDQTLDKK